MPHSNFAWVEWNITHDKQISEVAMNLKKPLFALAFAIILAIALPLRAQTGCADSPEDPTVVLALVGGAGALAASLKNLRGRKQ